MSLRSMMRNEFPRGWWHSARWWSAGLGEISLGCLVALASVLFVGMMRHAVRRCDDPWALSRLERRAEGFWGGLLVNGTGMVAGASLAVTGFRSGRMWLVLAGSVVLWCLVNTAVCCVVLVVLVRSRVRQQPVWERIDFVEAHAPKHGRPPETIEEYRAERLKTEKTEENT